VFIRQQAPLRGFADSTAISTLVARALRRAGVAAPHTGAHVFRHSLATGMLRAGASLAEIGELLRHRHPDTTRLYAKVDVRALRALALPWPGGGR
jgi:site-specific recombinase XerD